MLAAGMGKRLAQFTKDNTKCMVEVGGKKLIDHAVEALLKVGISRFIVVIGYKGINLKKYLLEKYSNKMDLVFIENIDYASTNNIYSFYLAKSELIKDDTLLMESDLIFDFRIIEGLLSNHSKNIAAVAKYKSWMDGTCVKLEKNGDVRSFISKDNFDYSDIDSYYKTVNIYKFSKNFLKNVYFPFLEAYMSAYGFNSYYETTLKLICKLPEQKIKSFEVGDLPWYEIDDEQDLSIANILFSKGINRYSLLMKQYGGFWRYDKFIDFCYLVNPFFPKLEMIDKFKNDYKVLLTQYPSGLSVQNMNASRVFGVNKSFIIVGNGATELINVFGHLFEGKLAVNVPTFNEYTRCFVNSKITKIPNDIYNYSLNMSSIKQAIDNNDLVVIVNPENPSGSYLNFDEVKELCEYAKRNKKRILIDESFIDFASAKDRYTFLKDELLLEFPNVIVIKSISKSYGVPGLRLGVLACSDTKLLSRIRNDVAIWNINSFAEYFLQTFNLFAKDYFESCDCIALEREYLLQELSLLKGIKVYNSSANFIMIDLCNIDSTIFCADALDKKGLIIKDLKTKEGFEGKNFVRISVRNRTDNNFIIDYFKDFFEPKTRKI